jgi:sulfur carrier protein ThiS adenylyltransferase
MTSERTTRYSSLIPVRELIDNPITIIGCGSIGRQLAIAAATMGCRDITLWDDDMVSEENLGPQGWPVADLGSHKVTALLTTLTAINSEIAAYSSGFVTRFHAQSKVTAIVFMCIDNIEGRQVIWKSMYGDKRRQPAFYCDARMTAETCRILTAFDPDTRLHYDKTFFMGGENPEPCTERSTFYCASIAAGLMLHQYTRWLRAHHDILEPDFVLSLPSMEINPLPLTPSRG